MQLALMIYWILASVVCVVTLIYLASYRPESEVPPMPDAPKRRRRRRKRRRRPIPHEDPPKKAPKPEVIVVPIRLPDPPKAKPNPAEPRKKAAPDAVYAPAPPMTPRDRARLVAAAVLWGAAVPAAMCGLSKLAQRREAAHATPKRGAFTHVIRYRKEGTALNKVFKKGGERL